MAVMTSYVFSIPLSVQMKGVLLSNKKAETIVLVRVCDKRGQIVLAVLLHIL